MASEAAQATGLPPKVEAWVPGGQFITSSRAMMAPSGIPLAMPLAEAMMSGCDADVLDGPHPAGPAHAALHLVADHEDAVPVAQLAEPGQEVGRGHDVSPLALDRLDEDRRHLVRR